MSQVIKATSGYSDSSGRSFQQRLIYLLNTNVWLMSYQLPGSPTGLNFLYNSSQDFTAGTWNTPTGSPRTLGGARTFGGSSPIGSHHNLAYANLGSTDVIHINYAFLSTEYRYGHMRAHFSGTTLTVDSDGDAFAAGVVTGKAVTADGGPPIAVGGCVTSGGFPLAFMDGGPTAGSTVSWIRSANADSGAAWTDDLTAAGSAVVGSDANTFNAGSGGAVPVGGGKGWWGGTNGGGGSGANPMTNIDGLLYNSGNFVSNPGFTSTGQQPANGFGAVDRGFVSGGNADLHCVMRTTSSSYAHRRMNVSNTWGAGAAIPSQANKSGEGVALTTDGTDVWLFVISSDAANTVKGIKWSGASQAWDAAWTTIEGSTKTRTALTVHNRMIGGGVGIMWTEVNGANFDIAGTYFVAPVPSPAQLGARPGLGDEMSVAQRFGGNCW